MKTRQEQYPDLIGRLFPQFDEKGNLKQTLTRTVTFQVTDDCNLRCTYCLDGDTLITMADFTTKKIRDVVIGDEIIGFPEDTEKNPLILEKSIVEQVHITRTKVLLNITFSNGKSVRITPEHPVLVYSNIYPIDECYAMAGELEVGDSVFSTDDTFSNIKATMITSIISEDVDMEVYNLGTSTRTYIANNTLVHNCYQINKHTNIMPFEVAKKFIDMILDGNEYINPEVSPAIIIEFIGGEPFMAVDVMEEITDYFIKTMIMRRHPWATKYRISISSNGTLYFNPKVQEYIKKHMGHLSLSISIDGNKELHDSCRVFEDGSGSYDIAMSAVRHYVDVMGGWMGSKMTLSPENIHYTSTAVINLIENGYADINLNCVYEKGWTADHALMFYLQLKTLADYLLDNNLEDEIELSVFTETLGTLKDPNDNQNWCGGTGYMLSVDYKGDIFPCIRYMESSLGTEIRPIILGNVYTGMITTDKEKETVKMLKDITRRSQSTDECFNCPIGEGCAWCSAYNYQDTGSVNKRSIYICIMHKARVMANTYYWNKRYRKKNEKKRLGLFIPKDWAMEIIPENEFNLLYKLAE